MTRQTSTLFGFGVAILVLGSASARTPSIRRPLPSTRLPPATATRPRHPHRPPA
jgi:hypothetical protein